MDIRVFIAGEITQLVLACVFICIVPALVMMYCYIKIIITVRNTNAVMAGHRSMKNKQASKEVHLTVVSVV